MRLKEMIGLVLKAVTNSPHFEPSLASMKGMEMRKERIVVMANCIRQHTSAYGWSKDMSVVMANCGKKKRQYQRVREIDREIDRERERERERDRDRLLALVSLTD